MFWQLTIDANDPEALARFWAHALGWTSTPPDGPEAWHAHYRGRLAGRDELPDRIFDPEGLRPPIWFQRVPDGKAGKNRLHLDLYPTRRDDSLEVEDRVLLVDSMVDGLVERGATIIGGYRSDDPDDPEYYVVLHDPEGNEFCVS